MITQVAINFHLKFFYLCEEVNILIFVDYFKITKLYS